MIKRKRSANWLPEEKMLLLDLIADNFSIINSKKTDGVAMRQKHREWARVSNEYNSKTKGVHRTAENLRNQWETLKKYTKKFVSIANKSYMKTGVVPPGPQHNEPIFSKIMGLLSIPPFETCKEFDDDNIAITFEEINCLSEGECATEEAAVDDVPSIIEPKVPLATHSSPDVSVESEDMDSLSTTSQDSRDDTLIITNDKVNTLKNNSKASRLWTSKRQRTLPAICSSAAKELQKNKMKTLAMQMKFAEIQRAEAKKLFEINCEIKKEILKQQKIKTRLLMLQLKKAKKQSNIPT